MKYLWMVLTLYTIGFAYQDNDRYWIYFVDKGDNTNPQYLAQLYPIECVARRAKVGKSFDYNDLPIYKPYMDKIENMGIKIHTQSKWLNAISVYPDPITLKAIESFNFVKEIKPVRRTFKREIEYMLPSEPALEDSLYGTMFSQLNNLGIIKMHRFGYTGQNVRIGVFDTGFNIYHTCFDRINIIDAYDFIFNDTIVSNEPDDTPSQHNHGTEVLSVISAYDEGNAIGGAYNALFILAKTEDVRSETPIEEDNWVRAGEWAESLGVDIITTSLGYYDWYGQDEMDGQTAVVSRAAFRLAQLGVIVCASNGNNGPNTPSMVAPADADSIISVGAIDTRDTIIGFSSRGPTADGRIKPDLVALGTSVVVAHPIDRYSYASVSGTSFSSPLIAGLCATILSCHPDWTPAKVISELKNTATNNEHPNNDYGWGKPNAYLSSAKIDSSNYLYFLYSGWNLISFPLQFDTLFSLPGQIGDFYFYNGSTYDRVFIPSPGNAYFVLIEQDTTTIVTGTPIHDIDVDLRMGWNLIGGDKIFHDKNIIGIEPLSSLIPNSLYIYNNPHSRYEQVSGTGPTNGYWILLSTPAEYHLGY